MLLPDSPGGGGGNGGALSAFAAMLAAIDKDGVRPEDMKAECAPRLRVPRRAALAGAGCFTPRLSPPFATGIRASRLSSSTCKR